MKTFYFDRDVDVSGVSGTGHVAEGVIFDDGHVCFRWLTDHKPSTTVIADCIEDVEEIHGHDGRTRIVYVE